MKKLLLLIFVAVGSIANAQTYWEEVSTGFPTTSTTQGQISYADANTVWTYATAGDGSGDFYQLWGRSLDGGVTWTNGPINLPSTDLAIGSIHAMSATTAYIAVFPNATTVQGGIWVTTNAGVTWTKQPTALYNTGTDSFTNLVHFFDTNNGVCQGDPAGGYFEIYTTTNGGTNWVRVPSANIPTPQTGEYGYTHNYETSGDIIWCGTNKGRIYKSINRGLNWTVAQSPITDFGSATVSGNFAMKNATDGIFVSSDWQFFRTTDGAVTWVSEFPGGEYYRNFDVSFVPGTEDTYVTTGLDIDEIGRGSSYSIDGGLTWIDINNIDLDAAVDGGGALTFYDCTHGLASGFTTSSTVGGIWHNIFDYCELAGTQGFAAQAFTASPNPTSGALEIAGKNIANVTVYDILGKEVMNSNYGSLNTVNINLGSLNTGVYMVKVTNDAGAASTTKVVKQ
jgi:hypothetical protein